jgi:hypothetical protein
MGRPKRLDNPKKITLSLAGVTHEQLDDLAGWLGTSREAMSRSEVVERAVAAIHAQTAEQHAPTPKKKRT